MKTGESKELENSRDDSPFSKLYDSLLTLVYPQSCKICGRSVESRAEGFACRKCWRKTKIFSGNEILCQKCGAFLCDGKPEFESLCHLCDEDYYDRSRAVGAYEKALLISVLGLKHKPYIPKILEHFFRKSFLDSSFQDSTCIIPVPLSKRRLSERGFNQSLLLAQSIAKISGLKINDKSLIRTAHIAKHRAGMDRKAREESVRNAFEVIHPRLVKNERVLLIDDVFTSGATVSHCAQILKKSGAEKVYVLTIARAA